jgi:hypothetical protein
MQSFVFRVTSAAILCLVVRLSNLMAPSVYTQRLFNALTVAKQEIDNLNEF